MEDKQTLELVEDEQFQKMEWTVQRFGWIVWGLIIIAALIGLLGPGPLSHAESSAPDNSLTVRYDRFLHHNSLTQLHVTLRPHSTSAEPLRMRLSQSLLDSLRIVRIEPEPQRRELTGDGIEYTFPHAGALESGQVLFHVEYERFGKRSGDIWLVGHDPIMLTQFVYP